MIGASREMVSRVMKDLEERGFIETKPDGSMIVKEALISRLTVGRRLPRVRLPIGAPDNAAAPFRCSFATRPCLASGGRGVP